MDVSIKYGPPEKAAVILDGVDITHAVLAEGFGVEFPEHPAGEAIVRLRLRADSLDIELPEGVVMVESEQEGDA